MIKIIKIITAINNPEINNKLNLENNIEIICKDLQYKDAILDVLNENNNVDIVIINNEIPSEIDDNELIKKIKEKNKKIRIIYILEKINKNIQVILENNNINDIYLNNEITIDKLIEIINKENNINSFNSNAEIKKELLELKNLFYENKKNNLEINNNNSKNNYLIKNKIITISGPPNVGKTNFIINFYKIINNKKILIIDFDLNKIDIKLFLGIKKYNKYFKKLSKNSNFENKYLKNNLENNADLISIKELIKNKFNSIDFDFLEFRNFIHDFFEKEKNKYDLILIDLGSENNPEINNFIFKNSDINILLTEGNLIGINKLKIFLNKFKKFNDNYIFKIVVNKKDIFSIDNIFLEKFIGYEIIGGIKYKKFYSNLINNNFNYFYNFKNNYKKE